ncbi:succinate dehydrogenase 3-1 [Tanacetum coccineum]
MARSFSNAKRLSSFFGDQLSVVISKRGLAAAPQVGSLGSGATMMNKVGEESLKPTSTVPEFRSNQVHSLLNHIHPFSSHANLYKSQIPSMLSFNSSFSTSATPSVSHARPLSPHLSIYKPQSNSMFSISNRIAAIALSGIALYLTMLGHGFSRLCYGSDVEVLDLLGEYQVLD